MRLKPSSIPRLILLLCLASPALAQQEPQLSDEEKRRFLLTARITGCRQLSKGITSPWKLTLTDKNDVTWYAAFQSVDIRKPRFESATGRIEINFRDSYHFNIAAYELSKLVALDHMMPVTVERKWAGNTGALAWWLSHKWDEATRIKNGIQPPDLESWSQQMHRMRVFAQLVYDTDRNLGNVLITEDWQLKMIDFTRAFRLHNDLQNARDLVRFDRQLLEKLKALQAVKVLEATKKHLGNGEVKAIMARRDKILALAHKPAQEKRQNDMLY